MKSLVFVILGKWNYGFNVLYCYQFARHTNSSLQNKENRDFQNKIFYKINEILKRRIGHENFEKYS